MKEVCSGRKFLKRTKIDESQSLSSDQPHQHNRRKPQRDFYVGATICLLSRDLKLVDYGDNATRIALDEGLEKTVAVLTPRRSRSGSCGALSSSLGKILQTVEECGLTLVDMKGFRGERGCYIDVDGRIAALGLDVDHLSPLDIGEDVDNLGGMCIAMELRGVNSLKIVSDLAVTIRREEEDTNTGDGSFVAASNMIDVELLRGVFLQPTPRPRRQHTILTIQHAASSNLTLSKHNPPVLYYPTYYLTDIVSTPSSSSTSIDNVPQSFMKCTTRVGLWQATEVVMRLIVL